MGKTYQAENLIVGVTYYNNRAVSVKTCCNEYEALLKKYLGYLKKLNEEGIVCGKTADVLAQFIIQVEEAQNLISEIGTDYSREILAFLADIDKADGVLFKNKGRKILTDNEFTSAMFVTNVELSFKGFFNYIVGIFSNFLADKIGNQQTAMAKRVKELGETTRSDLSKIQCDVRLVDKRYSKRLRNLYNELIAFKKILNKILEIVTPRAGGFTAKNISDLKLLIEDAEKFRKEVVKNPEYDNATDDDVKYFADNISGFFNKSTSGIRAICEESLAQYFITDFEKYRTTVNAAKEYFNSFSNSYTVSKANFDDVKKNVDDMLALYNKYGDRWINHCENKEQAKLFNEMIKKFSKISKASDRYVDIWYQMFFDMSESKAALDRFKANCDMTDENVKKAVERVEALYNKEMSAYLNETAEEFKRKMAQDGIENGAKAVANSLSEKNKLVGKLAEKIIEEAFAEMPGVAMYDWINATDVAFDNAIAKLKLADEGSAEYDVLVKSAREAFDAAKKARLDFYKVMLKSAKSKSDKNYYNYCIAEMKNASFSDSAVLNVMPKSMFDGSNYNPLTDVDFEF